MHRLQPGEILEREWRAGERLHGQTQQGQRVVVAGKAAGAEVLHEPRVWPEYHANYYGAFVRDPDGNNVEAVSHQAEAQSESS